MPSPAEVKASNKSYAPSHAPVVVFAGGTSGIGQSMAEAFARYTNGWAHIILIGRNADAAARVIAGFPRPEFRDDWRHEFIACDATSMAEIRSTCAGLRARLPHINFLVLSAGFNSMATSKETSEGLDYHLALRYYSRYVYIKELLPLLTRAHEKGQQAHAMTILGAGLGMPICTDDIGLDKARAQTIKPLKGVMLSIAAMKGMGYSPGYNDAMVAYFASQNPGIAFTHIHPGFVKTSGLHTDAGWLLAPLSWLYELMMVFLAVQPEVCAEYMLHALLDPQRGLFFRSPMANVFSSHIFDAAVDLELDCPTAHTAGILHGIVLEGYSGSDVTVKAVIEYTEEVTSAGDGYIL
ncbi:NAD(P)-binding protein [Mycena vulgaris]|nr:NAD(P)-binding protein [Mycena vulgaris]